MAKLEILKYPNPILRKKAKEVKKVTPELVKLAEDMLETMYAAPGVGLAAPQVGESIRLLTIDTRIKDKKTGEILLENMAPKEREVSFPLIIFNPKIVKKQGITEFEEGCLSVPGYAEWVKRAEFVVVEGVNEKGEKISLDCDGLLSICFQHEIDHLDGKLFIDRLSVVKGNLLRNRIRKNGYPESEKGQHLL